MSIFNKYRLHDRVVLALSGLGFRRPTQVQEKVIPLFLQEQNLIVEAPTGTGKTAAYGLPMISKLDLLKRSTQALVLAPTRELVMQISGALSSYFEGDTLKVAEVYGGVSMQESFEAIKRNAHILVAVPGRLRDVMAHYQHDYLWRDIKYLVIDEGDKLLESGFLRDFEEIASHVRRTVQVGFFSATISQQAEDMIRERVMPVKTIRLHPRDILKNIRFYATHCLAGERETSLLGLIQQEAIGKALIFSSRREDIHALSRFLRNCGLRAESYYGSQDQHERKNILERFKEDHIDYLVATDLAARGLDIWQLPAVINLAIPEPFDYYLHRVGRTGRAGRKGTVYNLLLGPQDESRLNQHHQQIGLPVRDLEVTPVSPAALTTDPTARWIKVHLSRGKRDKVRKADVAGFLIHEGGVAMEDIGTITIYETYAIVDLPEKVLLALQEIESSLKIKGKNVKIRKYQLSEQERKARANQALKRDRKSL